jgi:replicative DNA helicase
MDSIYSINIERSVLSSIIFDPEIIEDILGILKYTDFYHPAHQQIFKVMEDLSNNDLPIDEEFIRKRLSGKDIDDSIYLEILSSNPISNIMAYVAEIKDAAVKRELASLAHVIVKEVEDDEKSAIQSVDVVQNALYKITTDSASSELKDMETINIETLDLIQKMKERGDSYLIGETTGFISLDKKTTGFNAGDLVIIAARPAMGKTALVLNMALKNIEANKGVVIFSLEMPSSQLMLRLLSAKTSIPLQDLRKGSLSDQQWTILTSAFDELNTKKLWVDDNGSLNINQLRARVRKLAQNPDNNISMIIIDYLQLMQGTGTKDRHQEVSEISRGLKMLAREIDIPIIALSQLNRGLESRPDKRPMLSDIRESGSIEQDADIIMFVYRDDVYKERDELRKEKEAKDKGEQYTSSFVNKAEEDAELIIGKQRNGPTGTVKLIFQKSMTRFIDKEQGNAPIETVYNNMDTEFETKMDDIVMPDIL